MKSIGILYATREGQTKRIAEYIAAALRVRGVTSDIRDIGAGTQPQLADYSAVILAASVHAGKHEPEMLKFVKRHGADLDGLPAAFVSVTLSQAGAERVMATAEERAPFMADVQKMLNEFFNETGWHPNRVQPVAGALLYTKYNFFVRFIMKRIAKKAGAETDTSRDYEYTNWATLERFVDAFLRDIEGDEERKAS